MERRNFWRDKIKAGKVEREKFEKKKQKGQKKFMARQN